MSTQRGTAPPIHELDELKARVNRHIEMSTDSLSSVALVNIDINDMSPWYDVFGPTQRDYALEAVFNTISDVKLDYHDRLQYLGRHPYDKFMLMDTGNIETLEQLAKKLKSSIDGTTIPNPGNLPQTEHQWKGATVQLDPTHLTVRMGVAYQRSGSGQYNVEGLFSKVLEATESAKATPSQVMVVEFNPAIR
ncbi:GGDEF domain-containing protein [Candidatus Woesearchaeota archaeon]|nr:GGDEF domain-containing protein [Candidatus Woesearchaeota archaeon]